MQKVNVGDFKRLKMTKSQSVPSIMKKRNSMIKGEVLSAKLVPSHILTHYKTVTKKKISPVKKILLRNVSDPKIDTKSSDANEKHITVEDLGQPEYNSIICTINKLKKFEQQKVITNISHLPFALKSFLNEKVNFYIFIYIYKLISHVRARENIYKICSHLLYFRNDYEKS